MPRRPSSFCSRHRPAPAVVRPRERTGGFALLLTVVLLAFLVLLLVSLATLARVETQVAANNQQLAQARQNALLALNIALGQLQKHAGPDQRVTGTADLAGGSGGTHLGVNTAPTNTQSLSAVFSDPGVINGLTAVQAGTRYWTGVWGNSKPSAPVVGNQNSYEQTPVPVLLTWLVSGNEGATFNVSTTAGTFGQVTSAGTAATYTPAASVKLARNGSDLAAFATPEQRVALDPNAEFTITSPSGPSAPAVLLVGPQTAGTADRDVVDGNGTKVYTEPATDRYIAAPLVPIVAPPGAVPALPSGDTPTIGRYAYWVGDEGVKARINLVDRYASKTDATQDAEARYRLMTAPRSGVEAIEDFRTSAYALRTQSPTAVSNTAANMLALAQAAFLDPANLTPAKLGPRVHDFTTYSLGLEADTFNGGLRRDLTYYFEQPTLPTWMGTNGQPAGAGKSIIPAIYSPTGTAMTYGAISVPQWDVLYSFYNTAVTGATGTDPGTVEVQPSTPTQMGITPVVTLFRLQLGVRRTAAGGTYGSFHGLAAPLVVLANPYTTRLKTTNGLSMEVLFSEDYDPDPTFKQIAAFPWVQLLLDKNGAKEPDGSAASDGSSAKNNGGNYSVRVIATRAAGNATPIAAPVNGTDAGPALLSNIKFIIPPGTNWSPGEAKLFTLQEDLQVNVYGEPQTVRLTEGVAPSTAATFQAVISPPKAVDLPNTRDPAADGNKKDVYSAGTRGVSTTPLQLEFRDAVTGDLLQAVSGANLTVPGSPGPSSYSVNEGTVLNALPVRVREMALVPPGDTVYTSATVRGADGQRNGALRVYQDFNLRAAYFRLTGRSHSTAPYSTLSRGDSAIDPEEADGYNMMAFTNGVNVENPQAWGRSVTNSSTTKFTLLYDFPRRAGGSEAPVLSLGQLQHANLTADDLQLNVGHQPGHAFGNSYVSPFVAREKSIDHRADVYYTEYGRPWGSQYGISHAGSIAAGGASADGPYYVACTKTGIKQWTSATPTPADLLNRFFDISYLLNASVWDGYFFSTVPQSLVQTVAAARSLPPSNPRLQFINPATATVDNVLDGEKAAAQTTINGAFNVNSTSVDAWVALLGGMKQLPALPLAGGVATNDAIFPRSLRQRGAGSQVPKGDGRDGGDPDYSFHGFRQLGDGQIRTLAAAIVQQVRQRGPFVSLGHFINRSLIAATEADGTAVRDAAGVGFSGALQAAIDTGKLNSFSAITPTADRVKIPPRLTTGTVSDTARDFRQIHEDKVSRGTWSLYADGPNFSTGTTPDSQPQRSTGIPGWLTQADVLQAIGPVIAARSDTFTIRAYGEVVNPITGETKGRAWCEAVVQRLPDYVEHKASPTDAGNYPTDAAAALTAANQTFGRRFKVVSFRWLGPHDI